MIKLGDCIEWMKRLKSDSIDAIVADPPYELGFMGKAWDRSGIAFNPETWKLALRVLKPGAHLLAFGGTRTYHRMACAIEDAGFEVRDSIDWIYGQGFPKSLDVSKAIDKLHGAERPVVAERPHRSAFNASGTHQAFEAETTSRLVAFTSSATPEAAAWSGWGTALKPAHEPIILARKPLVGTVAANVLAYGTGGINVDGCRVGTEPMGGYAVRSSYASAAGDHFGGGRDRDREFVAREAAGRWPPNVLLTHAPGCRCVGVKAVPRSQVAPGSVANDGMFGMGSGTSAGETMEEIPTFECIEGCPVAMMDAQSGSTKSTSRPRFNKAREEVFFGQADKIDRVTGGFDDAGGASRFFPIFEWSEFDFLYCAKASRSDRGKENKHPTVKPIALMRWLVKLVTPPNGVVLDPFLGSGTTAVAALREGFRVIGFEKDDNYLKIAEDRIRSVG